MLRHAVAPTTLVVGLLLGGAAAADTPNPVQQRILESLSVDAYERVVPRLTALKPGDRIDPLWWDTYKYERQGKKSVLTVGDGWVAPLSGYFFGSFGFGRFIGQTGNVLLGEHVFGYLLFDSTLSPQYVHVLLTRATLISRDEYDRLGGLRTPNAGWTPTGEKSRNGTLSSQSRLATRSE